MKSLALILLATPSLTHAATAFHLAFGVNTDPSADTFDRLHIQDLHGDHYHNFTQNNGGAHVPEPFQLTPGGGGISFTLAAMEISPYGVGSAYQTDLTPAGDFHLVLISQNGIGPDQVNIGFWHGDHTHSMTAGSEEHLNLTEFHEVEFSFDSGVAEGDYSAVFRIVDENGNYGNSPDFTINVSAVPEPSSALLIGATLALGFLRRRR